MSIVADSCGFFLAPGIVHPAVLVGDYGFFGKKRRPFCSELVGKGIDIATVTTLAGHAM